MLLGYDRGEGGRITPIAFVSGMKNTRARRQSLWNIGLRGRDKAAHKGSQQAHSMPARPFLNTVLLGVIKRLRAVLPKRGIGEYRREIGVNPDVTVSKGPPSVA